MSVSEKFTDQPGIEPDGTFRFTIMDLFLTPLSKLLGLEDVRGKELL